MSDGIHDAPRVATAPSLKTVLMTPSTQTRGVRVDVDVMNLDDIPGAMDHMGWKVSAQMMRRWFATQPAWAMPEAWRNGEGINYLALPPSQVDDQIIKMKWLLGFDRLKPVFENLRQNWNTEKGIRELNSCLRKIGWDHGKTTILGRNLKTAMELDLNCQVNFLKFGKYTDTFDDLYGAIFRATLKIAIVGKASKSLFSARDRFEIERIGIYMRDTYDFNASLIEDTFVGLGVWSKKRMLSKVELAAYKTAKLPERNRVFPGFVPAHNIDFRRWQKHHNAGGDFFVFSDVLWTTPDVEYIDL
jgi:hypothetical protein